MCESLREVGEGVASDEKLHAIAQHAYRQGDQHPKFNWNVRKIEIYLLTLDADINLHTNVSICMLMYLLNLEPH